MLNRVSRDDEGFTLIELLVVILIIGILAAIALPSFLNQKDKGFDASAKSDVRNAVSLLESCYVDSQTFNHADCASATLINAASGLQEGSAVGQVQVSAATATTFTVSALSKSGSYFNVSRASSGGTFRCKAAAATTACASNTW